MSLAADFLMNYRPVLLDLIPTLRSDEQFSLLADFNS